MRMYRSKFASHQLVMDPSYVQIAPTGRTNLVPGRRIQFHRGYYQTNDKEEIAFIEGHKAFQRGDIIRIEKQATSAQAKPVGAAIQYGLLDENVQVISAAVAAMTDVARLEALRDAEDKGKTRKTVIAAIDARLAELRKGDDPGADAGQGPGDATATTGPAGQSLTDIDLESLRRAAEALGVGIPADTPHDGAVAMLEKLGITVADVLQALQQDQ